jgi:autotransporter-associated beta strand protein
MKRFVAAAVVLATAVHGAYAGSATWNLNPVDNNWNNPANWTPAIVPDMQATFDVSNVTHIRAADVSVESIVFNPGASAFTLIGGTNGNSFNGAGFVNNSAVVQHFIVRPAGKLWFYGSASADNMVITNPGGASYTFTEFLENSTAANATIINEGALTSTSLNGGFTNFLDSANAENATVINNPGTVSGAKGGHTYIALYGGHLGSSTFIANAATVPGAEAGWVQFQGGTCAGTSFIANGAAIANAHGGQVVTFVGDGYATFTANGGTGSNAQGGSIYLAYVPDWAQTVVAANGGTNGGLGGTILLAGTPDILLGQFQLFGNGTLDLTNATGSVTVGSLSGNGMVLLADRNLRVGTNNFSTSFSGVIEDSGRLVKDGTGTLTLTGANTYIGLTRVKAGVLVASNLSGSATGTGSVYIDAGTVGGKGIIQGTVTIGTGAGTGAFLAPSVGSNRPARLTLQKALTFKTDSTYTYQINIDNVRADQVIAKGITIENGAQFVFQSVGNSELAIGTVFTPIRNKSAHPIAGTFANLPDGSTVTVGPNNFQVSYSGGDGNDLTLTVVP